jgi:hypothetical protein
MRLYALNQDVEDDGIKAKIDSAGYDYDQEGMIDEFDTYSDGNLGDEDDWQEAVGGGTLQVIDNTIEADTSVGSRGACVHVQDLGNVNHFVQADVRWDSPRDDYFELAVRLQSNLSTAFDENYYLFSWDKPTEVYKVERVGSGGGKVEIKSGTLSLTGTQTVRFTVETIDANGNDVVKFKIFTGSDPLDLELFDICYDHDAQAILTGTYVGIGAGYN